MISKIHILKENKTIKEGFIMDGLKKMTVIVGENNSGKTNFFESLVLEDKKGEKFAEFFDDKGEKLNPKIVYIKAENIKPSESETKSTSKTAGLVKNLSELFLNLGVKFELENKADIFKHISSLVGEANNNLSKFTGNDSHKLKLKLNDKGLDYSTIIQALIKEIVASEDKEERNIEDLGQGTQRIIVASILKAYVDILINTGIHTDNPILILFEEPEIYLHPKLKRSLNETLREISEQKNHQVVIVTHDSYFAFKNMDEEEKILFSFVKEDGVTKISTDNVIHGIEDELLFIFLYSRLEGKKNGVSLLGTDIPKFTKRKYFGDRKTPPSISDLRYIRDQIHHLGGNKSTLGLVDEIPKDSSNKNYYTQEELSSAITLMSELLSR